jgi:hypothetical protein
VHGAHASAYHCPHAADATAANHGSDLPSAYEALARARAVAGNAGEARRFLELGKVEAAKLPDAEDREHLESQLTSILP